MPRGTTPHQTIQCIGVDSTLGAPELAHGGGPQGLRLAGLTTAIRRVGLAAVWRTILEPGRSSELATLEQLLRALADTTAAVIAGGDRPLVLGGDHSLAAGSWRGIGRALGIAPGLLWIDAHLDAHTPFSSPSGNAHGMPLAALLGEGSPAMTGIPGPDLDPRRVAVLGARSFEPAELDRLQRLGVRVFTMDDIRLRGLAAVFADARRIVSAGGPWGISLDLDAIDPDQAPGVSTPVPAGIAADDLDLVLHSVLRERNLVGLEIAEYNPEHDPLGTTARQVVKLVEAAAAPDGATLRQWEQGFGAQNYAPLPVVLSTAAGCWVRDLDGRRYLDFMSAYSATSFGHGHPRLVAALDDQVRRLAVTSRAYFNDRLPLLLRRLALLTGYERVLPLNSGLEAVETALKAARKWAYTAKGVPAGQAEIIACTGNFHGRSIAIVGLSSEVQYRRGFGPFPNGLRQIPYGDVAALATAITPNTAAFLVEPIQGEGGIIVPPAGYLAACAALCRRHRVLFIADEVQTGLGRTGTLLACEQEGVRPDGLILGKALGGGLLPVAAFLADRPVMDVFQPGDHGSTFGGNPLAAAVALAAIDVLEEEDLVARAQRLGTHLLARLRELAALQPAIRGVRGRGLLAGIELDPTQVSARRLAEVLLEYGVLSKDTHGTVLRLAPPLVISPAELDWGLDRIAAALDGLHRQQPRAA